ncbi:MAG: class I SAM-dependent methyltransferase [Bacteroidota bacterium]
MSDHEANSAWSTDSWRTAGGGNWLAQADRLEAMLVPLLDPLFAHAALRSGEQVLDIGCGRGATTYRAAREVGRTGAVTAVDVSSDLLAEAQSVASPASGDATIDWLVADAQRAELGDARFDAAISRFGVMFFDDAVAAFANVRRAVTAGGRLAMVTWRPHNTCDFHTVGWDAVNEALRANGYDVADSDPAAGPFSLGVDDVVQSVLGDAGWVGIEIEPLRWVLGEKKIAGSATPNIKALPTDAMVFDLKF